MADNVQHPITGTGTADVVQKTDDLSGAHVPYVKILDGTNGGTEPAAVAPIKGLKVDPHHNGTAVTDTWTSADAADSVVSVATTGYAGAVFQIVGDGAGASGGLFFFELSFDGGTTWKAGPAANLDSTLGPAAFSLAATDASGITMYWYIAASGATNARVRIHVQITGSESFAVRILATTVADHTTLQSLALLAFGWELTGLKVIGTAADGAAVSGNPVLVAGQDGTNVQSLKTDASGELQVDVLSVAGNVAVTNAGLTELAAAINGSSQMDVNIAASGATVPVSNAGLTELAGAINASAQMDVNLAANGIGIATAANQATEITALQLIDDPVQVLGTDVYTEAASKGMTIGAVRRDADTTLVGTTNEFGPLQMDANGRLKVEAFSGETLPVSLASTTVTGTVAVTDNSGSLTVDAPLATPVNVQIGNATLAAGVIDETGASAVDALAVGGGTAHDAVDSGNPVKVGGVAVSGSATPTSVASGDRSRWIFNQHGIPYTMAGHPNLITREYDFGTSPQNDVNLAAAAVAADERIYVVRFEALNDMATTVNVSCRAGFGASAVPTASSSGVSGMIASHPGIAPGSGIMCGTGAGLLAVGGAGEEPRITTSAATTGNLHVIFSYYLIDETP